MTLTHQLLDDNEPLALLISPIICEALYVLLARVDPAAGTLKHTTNPSVDLHIP